MAITYLPQGTCCGSQDSRGAQNQGPFCHTGAKHNSQAAFAHSVSKTGSIPSCLGQAPSSECLTCVSNANVDDGCLVLFRKVLWGGRESIAPILSLGHLEDTEGISVSQPDDECSRDREQTSLSLLWARRPVCARSYARQALRKIKISLQDLQSSLTT